MESVSLSKGILLDNLISFKQSLLFYPVVFALGSIILFIITSRIDEVFYREGSFGVPYIDPLIFTGDADASRNILSAITTGWATILGVAFSVTLITLQLSTTKYTSHMVKKFENDKLNQLMLAWFILVVSYSLLILKTVRTGDAQESIFTPIIGVNVAILLATIALFIFIAFLHNIASYLRPNMLVSSIVDQITQSTKPFEKRREYDGKHDKSPSIGIESFKDDVIFELKSKKNGICRSIDWKNIYQILQEFSKQNKVSLWMQWYKSLGDWIEKDDLIAIVYAYNSKEKFGKEEKLGNRINNGNKSIKVKPFGQRFVSNIIISNDRNISKDPVYGIELLRSLAVKSVKQSDTDVVNSCITGLFRILRDNLKSSEFLGIPFTLEYKLNDRTPDNTAISNTALTIINPKESKLSDSILFELSLILENVALNQQITVAKHFVREYISLSRFLLENKKIGEFERLTKWLIDQVSISIVSFQKQFQARVMAELLDFDKELKVNYADMAYIFENKIHKIANDEINSYINTSVGR